MAEEDVAAASALGTERMWTRDGGGSGVGQRNPLLAPQTPLRKSSTKASPAGLSFRVLVWAQTLLSLLVIGLGSACIELGREPAAGLGSVERSAYTSCSLGVEAASGFVCLSVSILGLILIGSGRCRWAYVIGCILGCLALVGGAMSAVVWMSLWSAESVEPPAFVLSFQHYFRTKAKVEHLSDTHPDMVEKNVAILGSLLCAILLLALLLLIGMCCGTQVTASASSPAHRRRTSTPHNRRRPSFSQPRQQKL